MSLGELRREDGANRFTLTITVFSSSAQAETITLRQVLDPSRFEVLSVTPGGGTVSTPPSFILWRGQASQDHPVTISVKLAVLASAPAGVVNLPVGGSNAAGQTSGDSVAVRVCCYHWPDPVQRLYLPVARR